MSEQAEATGGAGEWFTGPAGDRRRFRVSNLEPLPGGRDLAFRAQRFSDGRPVVLKLVDDADEATEQRLRQLTQQVAAAPHHLLATPLEVFRGPGLFDDDPPPDDECDLLFAVSEWVPGTPLRSVAPLDPDQIGALATDLAAAVDHLHERCGLVHRDIHPGNVIVDDHGRARLIDLGSALPPETSPSGPEAGVVGFVPPERYTGSADRRSDTWAVGMVVAHALVGHPVGDEPVDLVADELQRSLPPDRDGRHVANLLCEVLEPDPATRRSDLTTWAVQISDALRPRPVGNRMLVTSAIIIATMAALVPVAAALGSTNEGPEPATSSLAQTQDPTCLAVGESALGAAPTTERIVARHREALRATADSGCATEAAHTFGESVHQTVAGSDGEVVIVASEHGVVALTPAQAQSYREIAGRQRPENAVDLGGYPVSVETAANGTHSVRLSRGGVIIGQRSDTQSFWMPSPVLDLWQRHPDLGLPLTNPFLVDDGLRQDFERGYMFLAVEMPITWPELDGADLEVHHIDDAVSPLAGESGRQGIVRQPTGTAWWIDDHEHRRWIPDGDIWTCLGGHDSMLANDVPGHDLALVPLGPPASCELAP